MNRRHKLALLRFCGATLMGILFVFLSGTAVVRGDDPVRGIWMTTDFQVINLAPDTQPITARFLNLSGNEVYSFSDTLAGGAARLYTMTYDLPPGFTGTVLLETPIAAGMSVVHLEAPPEAGGNTVFAGVPDELVDTSAYTPIDRCVLLHIHTLSPVTVTHFTLQGFALDGAGVGSFASVIPPHGTIRVHPLSALGLPLDFTGLAVLAADQPIQVVARSICGGFSALVAPPRGSTVLFAPVVPTRFPSLITATLTLQNAAVYSASVDIQYSSGYSESLILPPQGGAVLDSPCVEEAPYRIYLPLVQRNDQPGSGTPLPATWSSRYDLSETCGSALILSDQPIVAVIRVVSARYSDRGTYTYRAFGLEEATPAVALPVLFSGYDGWRTGSRIWVSNVSTATTAVTIRYVDAEDGTVLWDQGTVGPGEIWQATMPLLAGERTSAILLADQPIVVLTGAFNSGAAGFRDRRIRYRGANFNFGCDLVSSADFGWEPLTPTVGQVITFTASASGTAPISYTWNMGDGTSAEGPVITHSYILPLRYDVTLETSNCLGFGLISSTHTVTVTLGGRAGLGVYRQGAPEE